VKTKLKAFAALSLSAVMLAAQMLPALAAGGTDVIDVPEIEAPSTNVRPTAPSAEYPAETARISGGDYYPEIPESVTYVIDSYDDIPDVNVIPDKIPDGMSPSTPPLNTLIPPETFEDNVLIFTVIYLYSGGINIAGPHITLDGNGDFTVNYSADYTNSNIDTVGTQAIWSAIPRKFCNENSKISTKEYRISTVPGSHIGDLGKQSLVIEKAEDMPDYVHLGPVNFEDNVVILAGVNFPSISIFVQNPYIKCNKNGIAINYTAYYPNFQLMQPGGYIICAVIPKEDYNGGETVLNETRVYENGVKEYPAETGKIIGGSREYIEPGAYVFNSHDSLPGWIPEGFGSQSLKEIILPETFKDNVLVLAVMNYEVGVYIQQTYVRRDESGNLSVNYTADYLPVLANVDMSQPEKHIIWSVIPKEDYNGGEIVLNETKINENVKEYPAETGRTIGGTKEYIEPGAYVFNSHGSLPGWIANGAGQSLEEIIPPETFGENVVMFAIVEFNSGPSEILSPYTRRDEYGNFSINFSSISGDAAVRETHVIWSVIPKEDYNGSEITLNETKVNENVKEYSAKTSRLGYVYPDEPLPMIYVIESYDDVPYLNNIPDNYNIIPDFPPEFFEDNIVILAIIMLPSGSFEIRDPYVRRSENGDFSVNYTLYRPSIGTDDVVMHSIQSVIPKEDYNGSEIALNETEVYENIKEYAAPSAMIVGGTEDYRIPGVRIYDSYDAVPDWLLGGKQSSDEYAPMPSRVLLRDLVTPETFEDNVFVVAVLEQFSSGGDEIRTSYARRDENGDISINYSVEYSLNESLGGISVIWSVIPKKDYNGGEITLNEIPVIGPPILTYENAGHTFVYNLIENGKAVKIIAFERTEESSTDVIIPRKIDGKPVRVIGEQAFSNNGDLTNILIPYGVAEIQSEAFFGCSLIENISVPESVVKIDSLSFINCWKLREVKFFNPDPQRYSSSMFGVAPISPILMGRGPTGPPGPYVNPDIYVPEQAIPAYQELFYVPLTYERRIYALDADEIIEWDNLIYGDVVGEGEPTLASVVAIAKYILEPEENKLTATQKEAAKVSHDGKEINIRDVLKLSLFLTGKVKTFD
jgi:hypothetical protein